MVHDVDRQKIPVRFVISSAGLVGSDGPTHTGAFDITYMSCLPNMIVMAPSDEIELAHMVATAAQINDRPVCFRYPRGAIAKMDDALGYGVPIEANFLKPFLLFNVNIGIYKHPHNVRKDNQLTMERIVHLA